MKGDWNYQLAPEYMVGILDFTFSEVEAAQEVWLFVPQQLPYLQNRPQRFQERVFQKLFEIAEIAKFSPDEKVKYEEI